jgi:uncharacterized protein (DUF2252 family)
MKYRFSLERDAYGILKFISDYKPAEKRKQEGKALRKEFPRESHAEFDPASDREDPVSVIQKSSEGRLDNLIPIRYGRMSKSPFAFLRGSASLMAMDIATTITPDIRVQACGDCHLSNFGLFATPERNLVFDINDFDETLPAPFEWDLKRLAASFYVVGRNNRYSEKICRNGARICVRSYREAIAKFASMKTLDVWYAKLDADTLIASAADAETKQRRQMMAEKARSRVAESLFPKITQVLDGRRYLVDQPPLLYHPPPEMEVPERLYDGFEAYRETLSYDRRVLLDRYRIEDIAIKVVGVGSVGTLCGVILLMAEANDPLLLQLKQANASVLEPYAGKSEFKHHGERVVTGQRLMQSASDMLLGWTTGTGEKHRHFYIRQLRDMKFSIEVEMAIPALMGNYAQLCGWSLARAHARSGDAAMISGYLGKTDIFDRAIGTFAQIYADQTEADYARFVEAIKSGEIKADMEN